MKRWMWFALAAGVMAAAAVTLVALPEGTEWTSDSPEAIAEFQAGIDAQMKIYLADSVRHFRRAVELDPDFALGYVGLADTYASFAQPSIRDGATSYRHLLVQFRSIGRRT